MIQNKCASQFFKIQNSTFPKIDTNDRLYLRHSYLFILQRRNITTINTTEVSSKSSSQVIRYTVYCFHTVIAATSHYTEKKPPLLSLTAQSQKQILIPRKSTNKPLTSSKRYKFYSRNSSRKTKSYYQIPKRPLFATCFKGAVSTSACHCC